MINAHRFSFPEDGDTGFDLSSAYSARSEGKYRLMEQAEELREEIQAMVKALPRPVGVDDVLHVLNKCLDLVVCQNQLLLCYMEI